MTQICQLSLGSIRSSVLWSHLSVTAVNDVVGALARKHDLVHGVLFALCWHEEPVEDRLLVSVVFD